MSSVPCVHGIDCIKITFPSCLSMGMVLAWSVASEDSGMEPESVVLNKRQTQTPNVWLQGKDSTEKLNGNRTWRPWILLWCPKFRWHILKWMGLHYAVLFSEMQSNFWFCWWYFWSCWLYFIKLLPGRRGWQLNTLVTVTLMFAAQSITESGIEKYLRLSVCQYVWWGVIKIHLSYGSWQLLTGFEKYAYIINNW